MNIELKMTEKDLSRLNNDLKSSEWVSDNFYGAVVVDNSISVELTTESVSENNILVVEVYDIANKELENGVEYAPNVTDDYPISANAVDLTSLETVKNSVVAMLSKAVKI